MAPGEIILATLAPGLRRVWPRGAERWRLNWDHAERLRLQRQESGQSWNPGLNRRSQDAMVSRNWVLSACLSCAG